MELLFRVNENDSKVIYVQLYEFIKKQILEGKLEELEKLPSVRNFGQDLGLSTTTIESAYNQLLVEGYIISKPRRGYFVNKLGEIHHLEHVNNNDESNSLKRIKYKYDFKSEYIEKDKFDFSVLKRHINYVLNYKQDKLLGYGDVQGDIELRKEIVKYVNRTRGIQCNTDNMIIGSGIYPLLVLLTSLFSSCDYKEVAFENPGFNRAKDIFVNYGFNIHGINILTNDMDILKLEKSKAKVCYVSPSHQFPTGNIMTIDNRIKLIEWAVKNNGYIIEDDFNSELRYEGQPIAALKGIDGQERVIYLGSFSTVLVPSIRISFMILPDKLNEEYKVKSHYYSQTASIIEQLALGRMMNSGDFEKHIRKIRKKYSKKREYIIKLLAELLDEDISIHSMVSGLHILIKLRNNIDVVEVIDKCKERDVIVSGLNDYAIGEEIDESTIVLNYRGIDMEDIEKGIRIICGVLNRVEKRF